VIHRGELLAELCARRRLLAIAGTHGKTTTTSMITTVLRRCGADPSYVIGGALTETGVGAAEGTGTAFVAEADESDGSFLTLAPDAAVVTCVEADHLDNYGSLADIEDAFAAFARKISADGLLVTDADDAGARKLARSARVDGLPLRLVSYGESEHAEYRLASVRPAGMATEFELEHHDELAKLRIAVPGRHNAKNAAAAFALAVELGFDRDEVGAGLASYRGAMRRMEPKGEVAGVRVLDSYAHHPTELAVDLAAARDIAAGGRVIAIFQPHLFSRTRIFADQFSRALSTADEVFVLDVYAAREDPEPGVTGALVADGVPAGRASFWPDRDTLPDAVADVAKPGDVVLTMGAGDVTKLGPLIVGALRRRDGDEP
jgi:UDP-N-acetylmuramate--alanine ligase